MSDNKDKVKKMNMQMPEDTVKNKKWITWCVLGVLFLLACLICVYGRVVSYNNGAYVDINGSLKTRKDATEFTQIQDGTTIETEFTTDAALIRALAFQFKYDEGFTPNGTVNITLYNAQTGEVIVDTEHSALNMNNEDYANFGFEPLIKNECKTYRLVITFHGLDGRDISMYMEDGKPYLAVITAGADAFYRMQTVCYILVISLIAVCMVCMYSNRLSVKLKLEHIYIIAGLTLGIVYSLIIPVATVPDEPGHMNKAYLISNHILGIPDSEDGTVKMRASEANVYLKRIDLDRTFYNDTYEGLFEPADDTTITTTQEKPLSAPSFLYFLASLGITFGRLLGCGTILMYMLGRLCNTLFFVWAVYYSIKKIPFAKSLVFVWALMPIVLQQANSISYDSPIMAFCILITALTLRFLYDDAKVGKSEVIIYILSLLLLLPCKGYAFFPMVLFVLALVPKLIRNKKDKIDSFKEKHPWWKKAMLVTVIGLALVIILGLIIAYMYFTSPEHMHNTYISWAQHEGYSIGYFLKNPNKLISVLLSTLFVNGEGYVLQMFGSYMGWLEVHVSVVFLLPYAIILVLAAMRKESEVQQIGVGTKIYMWLIYIGICGLTAAAMLMFWTPNTSGVINGFQGRYLLPALPIALIACRTKRACVSDNSDRYIVLTAVYMQIFIITSVFLNF